MSSAMITLVMFCIMAETGYALCFKSAADGSSPVRLFRQPVIWLGALFWAAEMAAWVVVLEHAPLSVAFPLMSLVYVTIVAGGVLILKEKVNLRHAMGAVLIMIGVACIGVIGL